MCPDGPSADVHSQLAAAVRATPDDPVRIRDLIARGACLNRKNESGEAWFADLLFYNYDQNLPVWAVELLIDAGADVNEESDAGNRPLWNACAIVRPELVRCLLARGADPNFLVDGSMTLLDDVECDAWHRRDQIGTVWEQESDIADAAALDEIAALLKAAGAKSLSKLRVTRLEEWVELGPWDRTEVITARGMATLSELAGVSVDWLERWQSWCGRHFDPGDDDFLSAPVGFDRRGHSAEGLALARELKRLAAAGVRVDFCTIDPDSEEQFARNVHTVVDVGGAETPPELPARDSTYAVSPGFFVQVKAKVAPDLSRVEPVAELIAGGSPVHGWRLNLDELERSCTGDGSYRLFTDQAGRPGEVGVLWGAEGVHWSIPGTDGADRQHLTFRRAGYVDVVKDALASRTHVLRRARVAMDKRARRMPRVTGLGTIEGTPAGMMHPSPPFTPTPEESLVAGRSRIWAACVQFAWSVNRRSLAAIDAAIADRCCLSGDSRPRLRGRAAVLDYLAVALADSWWQQDGVIAADVAHFWLTAEPCVHFWHAGQPVSLANVSADPDGRISSIYYVTDRNLVAAVKGLNLYPGRTR